MMEELLLETLLHLLNNFKLWKLRELRRLNVGKPYNDLHGI